MIPGYKNPQPPELATPDGSFIAEVERLAASVPGVRRAVFVSIRETVSERSHGYLWVTQKDGMSVAEEEILQLLRRTFEDDVVPEDVLFTTEAVLPILDNELDRKELALRAINLVSEY